MTFCSFSAAAFVVLTIVSVWCEALPEGNRWDFINDPWITNEPRPPVPTWPQQFISDFYLYIKEYGEDFQSKGAIIYDWTKTTFRGDFYDFCIPLIDTHEPTFNNFTCTFLASEGNMYYIEHTSTTWNENKCCLFQAGLGAVSPDWMGVGQYNGTAIISGVNTDVWWFPGSNDAENDPCYGYWSATDDSKRPIQFFGLVSSGRDGGAILEYYTFTPGEIPEDIPMIKPNIECEQECAKSFGNSLIVGWPEWPYCE